jgi:hypothetical protein
MAKTSLDVRRTTYFSEFEQILGPFLSFSQIRDALLAQEGEGQQIRRDSRQNGHERGCAEATIRWRCHKKAADEHWSKN